MEEYLFIISLFSLPVAIIALSFSGLKSLSKKKSNTDISDKMTVFKIHQVHVLIRFATFFLFIGLFSQILILPALNHHLQSFHPIALGTKRNTLLLFIVAMLPIFILLSSGFLNLYFKYTPSFRHKFLPVVVTLLNFFLIINIILVSYFYLKNLDNTILPKLVDRAILDSATGLWPQTLQTLTVPLAAFLFLFIANKQFKKKKSKKSLSLYRYTFILFLIIIVTYGYNLYLNYFVDSGQQAHRLNIFNMDLYYSGIFVLIVLMLSIVSFIYLAVIYRTQQYLLARPLSGVYILKLAHVNLLSSFTIILFLVLPWLLKQYFILVH